MTHCSPNWIYCISSSLMPWILPSQIPNQTGRCMLQNICALPSLPLMCGAVVRCLHGDKVSSIIIQGTGRELSVSPNSKYNSKGTWSLLCREKIYIFPTDSPWLVLKCIPHQDITKKPQYNLQDCFQWSFADWCGILEFSGQSWNADNPGVYAELGSFLKDSFAVWSHNCLLRNMSHWVPWDFLPRK